ncbi:MAG: universal stress protein [Terrimicrobiaceae bacterium]
MKPTTRHEQNPKKASPSPSRRNSRQKRSPSRDSTPSPHGNALARKGAGEGKPLNIRKIVVPVDFSKAGQAAIGYAASFANLFDASLVLTHVIQRIYYGDEFSYLQISTRRMRERVTKDLRTLMTRLPVAMNVEIEVREGSSSHEIVAVAKEKRADVIIMATHGYTGLKHAFLGSTAERVVQHAPCPVLIVPPGTRE